MWTELILLTSALLGAYAETISARAGADVLLPCHCPENPQDSLYVAWQIGNHTIVDYYHSKWNKTDPNNKTDHKFLGRTQLFLPKDKGNCSLLLKNVETADNETYSCHHKNPDYTKADVTLIVSEAPPKPPTPGPLTGSREHDVTCAIGGVILVLGILLTVFLTIRYRSRTTVNTPRPQDGEQNHPLNPDSV